MRNSVLRMSQVSTAAASAAGQPAATAATAAVGRHCGTQRIQPRQRATGVGAVHSAAERGLQIMAAGLQRPDIRCGRRVH